MILCLMSLAENVFYSQVSYIIIITEAGQAYSLYAPIKVLIFPKVCNNKRV